MDAAKRAEVQWSAAVAACNEQHGTGGWDDFQICDRCGVNAIDAAVAEAVANKTDQAILDMSDELAHLAKAVKERDATIATLVSGMGRMATDNIAYRGALGYPVPGEHDGRLSDGTIPQCGLCGPKVAEAQREEREWAARQAGHEHNCETPTAECRSFRCPATRVRNWSPASAPEAAITVKPTEENCKHGWPPCCGEPYTGDDASAPEGEK